MEKLTIEHVSYQYPGSRSPVLRDLSGEFLSSPCWPVWTGPRRDASSWTGRRSEEWTRTATAGSGYP